MQLQLLETVALLCNKAVRYLGLFRTDFGIENSCRLVPHQERSLRQCVAGRSNPEGGALAAFIVSPVFESKVYCHKTHLHGLKDGDQVQLPPKRLAKTPYIQMRDRKRYHSPLDDTSVRGNFDAPP